MPFGLGIQGQSSFDGLDLEFEQWNRARVGDSVSAGIRTGIIEPDVMPT